MSKIQSFIFGKDKIPTWFNDYCYDGRAKVTYDDEGNPEYVTIYTITGVKNASIGDSVILTKSGLGVLPKEKAIKYGVQRNVKPVKEEETNEKRV